VFLDLLQVLRLTRRAAVQIALARQQRGRSGFRQPAIRQFDQPELDGIDTQVATL
jgi:hypothetical protein